MDTHHGKNYDFNRETHLIVMNGDKAMIAHQVFLPTQTIN